MHELFSDSMVCGRCGSNLKSVTSEHMLQIDLSSTCKIALKWMPQNTFDDKSTLVQAVACRLLSAKIMSEPIIIYSSLYLKI